jgi:cobalt-zinc-cadmium efflux system membrane fusion protein
MFPSKQSQSRLSLEEIKATTLLVGDKVRKGQALLTLENTNFRYSKEYLEVAEQIKYLKSEYERQKTLYDENYFSKIT